MPDREKVIKGLKLHGDPRAECDECPYRNEESPGYECLEELCNDVIALLKEQEAMNVDTFMQWCIDSHIMGDATVRGIKYWVGKFKEGR